MLIKFSLLLAFTTFLLSCGNRGKKFKDPNLLKEEFDICAYWHDNMTWSEFLKIKNGLQRRELVKYVDKIEQQKIAKELGIDTPKTYLATREKTPVIDIVKPLTAYVAKMTHLSLSQGLIIVKDGVDIVTGRIITPQLVQDHLFKHLDEKARDVESWALHNVPPGFMIQEYIQDRREVKIQTIWGKAVIGEWRGGESQTATTTVWGRYDRNGVLMSGTTPAPLWWPKAITAAEKFAVKTDALRVDFLVRLDDELVFNELEIWPESDWASMQKEIEKKLNDGYRGMCQ